MNVVDERKIEQLQKNLSAIRKMAKWTTERLAEETGVSRQTISSLENGKTTMTKMQYLAIRTVFNSEIEAQNNKVLAYLIKTVVDDPAQEVDFAEEYDKGRKAFASSGAMESLSDTTRSYVEAGAHAAAPLR